MFCSFAKALNYIFLFISLQNEAAKKYFLVSLFRIILFHYISGNASKCGGVLPQCIIYGGYHAHFLYLRGNIVACDAELPLIGIAYVA